MYFNMYQSVDINLFPKLVYTILCNVDDYAQPSILES